jgi:hypothetical protein
MLASLLIIAFSLILLAYWFRYTCLLLLRNSRDGLLAVGHENFRLNYREVEDCLNRAPDSPLDPLRQALDRDYALLSYVLQHAAGINLNPVERHMLSADYRIMNIWYRLVRSFSPAAARSAVEEMALVVSVLSQRMGHDTAN